MLFEQSLGFQATHEQAGRVAVDPDPFGEPALVEVRLAIGGVDVGHHRKLEWREIGVDDRLGARRVADLEEPAGQCERNSPEAAHQPSEVRQRYSYV